MGTWERVILPKRTLCSDFFGGGGAFLFVGGFVDGDAEAGGGGEGGFTAFDAEGGERDDVGGEAAVLGGVEVGGDLAEDDGFEEADVLGPDVGRDQGAGGFDLFGVVAEGEDSQGADVRLGDLD